MGDPTISYATAGIALRVSGALKPHHQLQGGRKSSWEANNQPTIHVFHAFLGLRISVWCSQGSVTGMYPEPDKFSSQPHAYFFKIHFNTILTSTPVCPMWCFPFMILLIFVCISHPPSVRYILLPSHYASFHHTQDPW
jgi:hypothetical protein